MWTVAVSKQLLMHLGLAVYAVLVFLLLTKGGTNNNAALAVGGAVTAAWLASPLIMLTLRSLVELNSPTGLFNSRTQSWMFLYGDIIFLPFAFACAALGWRKLDTNGGWYTSMWWLILAATIGIVAGVIFHHLDVIPYTQQGMELALNSPTKWAHDFVAYPVLFAGLVYFGAPMVFGPLFRPYGILILIGVVLWGTMGIHDAKGLQAKNLHPKWDQQHFRIIS